MADKSTDKKRARFRFKAQIYDTEKNNQKITFYVINIKIYGFNIDEYEIKKRFSQFAEFDNRLKARFHHSRLPHLPSKTLTKSNKHDDEFISKRKIALNRYLRGIGQRLYLQNCEAIWQFFEFMNIINPFLHRYRVIHLKSIQCNDYEEVKETEDTKTTKLYITLLFIHPFTHNILNSSGGFSFKKLFSSNTKSSSNKLSFATSKTNKKILREWRVIYGAFIESDIYLSVSTIHSDNTKNNWWDSLMSTANDAKALIASNNPLANNNEKDANNKKDVNKQEDDDHIETMKPQQNDDDEYNREDRLESVDFDSKSDLSNLNNNDDEKEKGLSAWEAEKLAFAQNEFYLGKIEIFKWNKSDESDKEIMYTSHCRFPLVRNRPSCALFISQDNLLLVGTSHGKILCFKYDPITNLLSHSSYLPRVFGSYVTGMCVVQCEDIYYTPSALAIRADNPLPRGTDKTQNIGTCFLYAVSNDCHLAVFDLRSGDCIGHVQTGITGNLSICYCCEKFFVSNKANSNIVVFIRSSKTGDPVPQTELIGHTTTVYCLHADEFNKRLFSGSGDNSVAVWYYDKMQDTMLQIQQLKSVSKSSKFSCITTAKNINCLIAGSDNGFITIWHEYDLNCDELSDKMYDLRMLIKKRDEMEQKCQKVEIDTSDNVPPSLTQQSEILKQNEKKYDISKNALKNGSISSKKNKTNMVWKCVYTWKAHKGCVTTVTYFEEYNMLMSTSQSGQIRLVYLCDPGKVPPMEMVKDIRGETPNFPEIIKDKLNKTFNEINLMSNNYPNAKYQDLNLLDEYQAVEDNKDALMEENKIEEEPQIVEEEEEVNEQNGHFDVEQLQNDNAKAEDMWKGNEADTNIKDDFDDDEDDEEKEIEEVTTKGGDDDDDKLVDEMINHEDTSLADLL